MLLGVGQKALVTRLDVVSLDCRPCGEFTDFAILKRSTTGYLMGIPILPGGTTYHLKCLTCWSTYDIQKKDAEWLMSPNSDVGTFRPRNTIVGPPGGRH